MKKDGRLKNKLQRSPWRWVIIGSIVCLLLAGGVSAMFKGPGSANSREAADSSDAKPSVVQQVLGKQPIELVLKRKYVCGQETEEKQTVQAPSVQDLEGRYPDWKIVSAGERQLVLEKKVEDLAPQCKANGFFGIDEQGNLVLFNGLPKNKDVIETFYRINTKRMESSLPRDYVAQLYEGIRIHDLAEYNSVLSTFGEFSVHDDANDADDVQ